MVTLRKAERKKSKLKIGLTSPSGCGKTFSSLLLAAGLAGGDWEKVAIIDTEGSGDKYAGHLGLGPFNVIDLNEDPMDQDRFSPDRYINALKVCVENGIEVAILDSATHEWQWCLDYQTRLGGRYQDWKKVTPLHDRFIRAIVNAPIHVIVCTRRKTDYGISNDGGRTTVTKVGLKSEIREGFEYELDLVWGLNHQHMAEIEKDRTSLFHNRAAFVITQKTGEELARWAMEGSKKITIFNKENDSHMKLLEKRLELSGAISRLPEISGALNGKPTTELTLLLEGGQNV